MSQARFTDRARLILCSRSAYRFFDIVCSHVARILDGRGRLAEADGRRELDRLNLARAEQQRILREIGAKHAAACADCEGRCCHGPRERDTFTDRVLQEPETAERGARRPKGPCDPSRRLAKLECPTHVADSQPMPNCCPELTSEGCRLPFELRPIQCVTYFCQACIRDFSREDCGVTSAAVKRLIGIEVAVALLALKLRLRGRPSEKGDAGRS